MKLNYIFQLGFEERLRSVICVATCLFFTNINSKTVNTANYFTQFFIIMEYGPLGEVCTIE